ncbi:hypothetical protein [Streptomyces aureocirculatus]|nr:hypothetical protein [Streptomyces aureocirculatus]
MHGDDRALSSSLVKSTLPMSLGSPDFIIAATAVLSGCPNFGKQRAPVP